MNEDKKKRLEAAGFKIGTIEEFLNMEPGDLDCVIIRHGKPIGVCECLGKGKESCRGNGWIKDGHGYQKCPYFTGWDTNEIQRSDK